MFVISGFKMLEIGSSERGFYFTIMKSSAALGLSPNCQQ
jgi:hypothetical protein